MKSKIFKLEIDIRDRTDDYICELLESGVKEIEIKEHKPQRSNSQNSSIWLFCTWISTILNDCGQMYTNPMGLEIPWTKDLVMEIYWRPLQKQLYKKKSTTMLTTSEVSPIADAIIMHFAKQGYELEFPNFQSLMNKFDSEKYQNNL